MSRSIRVDAGARDATARTIGHVVTAAAGWIAPAAAHAHGFGQRYDLPLPLSLYLSGTAAAIVLSFVVVGVFVRRARLTDGYPWLDLRRHPLGRLIASRGVARVLALIALCFAVVTVLAGFLGNQNPYQNIAPTLVWIIGWVGLLCISAFIGNLWAVINPWRTLFDLAASVLRRTRRGNDFDRRTSYPEALGVWPAFALLLAFAWIELVYPSPAVPAHIAWMLVGYSMITWSGMAVFGRDAWLRHGELFSVVFGLFARFAPTEVRVLDPMICATCAAGCGGAGGRCIDCPECLSRAGPQQWTLALRPFGAGLLDRRPVSTSMTAFVLLVLSTVLYDGVLGTPEWSAIESSLAAHAPGHDGAAAIAVRTVGLVVFWALFFGAYLAVNAIMSAAGPSRGANSAPRGAAQRPDWKTRLQAWGVHAGAAVAQRRSTWDSARSLALTLVPIAIAYSLAHYLTYLLIQGQYIVPLLSDPFGYGWDLFGTAGYRVDVGIVGARFAWYAAVTAIVLGHAAAVYLAHTRSMQMFAARRDALWSQVPLTALMVAYTFVSLSILAEPITERRPSAQPTALASGVIDVPQDAVLPEPGTGRMQAVGAGKVARQKLTYRVLGSAFHDGTPMDVPDILYAYMFAYRWGVRNDRDPSHYDPAVDAATAAMRQRLVGIKFIGTDTKSKSFRVGDIEVVRELFVFDIYTTGAPEDPEQDAAFAPPWSTLPWHLIVLMEEAVGRGLAAFSQAEAERRGVEWLDLARSDRLKSRLAPLVAEFARDGYRPDSLRALVSAEAARKRWGALAAFYQARGHFLVTNGPYQLKAWSADGATLDVFRDLSYPLGVGSFDAYAIPRRGFITNVEGDGSRLRILADIETIMKYQRSYDIVRTPLQSLLRSDVLRDAPECRYVVLDASGNVVLAGTATPADDATFRIDFTGKLPAGQYTALAEITVNGNASNVEIRRIPLRVSPAS